MDPRQAPEKALAPQESRASTTCSCSKDCSDQLYPFQ